MRWRSRRRQPAAEDEARTPEGRSASADPDAAHPGEPPDARPGESADEGRDEASGEGAGGPRSSGGADEGPRPPSALPRPPVRVVPPQEVPPADGASEDRPPDAASGDAAAERQPVPTEPPPGRPEPEVSDERRAGVLPDDEEPASWFDAWLAAEEERHVGPRSDEDVPAGPAPSDPGPPAAPTDEPVADAWADATQEAAEQAVAESGGAPAAAREATEQADAVERPAAGGHAGASRVPTGGPLPGDARLDPQALSAAARDLVRRALDEDLDVAGDLTSLATVAPDAAGEARLVARAEGVVAGLDLVALVYDLLDPRVEVAPTAADGDRVGVGQVVAHLRGPLRSLLTGERTALNLVTHLSGVATHTARYVAAVEGTGCAVRDTRKTLPGLRLLEKAAVRAGGGVNHRLGLSDALLVKDNHVAAAGGVAAATRAALAGARGRHVQVEVDDLDGLEEAVEAGARDVLLDNFDVDTTRRAVQRVRELEATHGRILLESSGGVDLGTVRDYAEAGVDRVAVGDVTHSAPQLDLALDLVDVPARTWPQGADEQASAGGRE